MQATQGFCENHLDQEMGHRLGLQCVFFLRGVIHVCLGVQGMHTYMEGSRCMRALGRGSRCLDECVGGWSKCLGGVQVPGGCPCVWVKSHILGGGLCDLPSESISLHSLLPPHPHHREQRSKSPTPL